MSFSLVSIYYYYRVLRENVAALKDIIKTIGQKQGNALNGTLEVHVQNHFFLFTTEKKEKQNVYAMNKMATCSGMKQDGVIGCTHRYQISSWMLFV